MSEAADPLDGETPVSSETGNPLAGAVMTSALNITIALLCGVLVLWGARHWKTTEFPCDFAHVLVWFLPVAPAPPVLGIAAVSATLGIRAMSDCRAASKISGTIVSLIGLVVLGLGVGTYVVGAGYRIADTFLMLWIFGCGR